MRAADAEPGGMLLSGAYASKEVVGSCAWRDHATLDILLLARGSPAADLRAVRRPLGSGTTARLVFLVLTVASAVGHATSAQEQPSGVPYRR
jgi:hypothetical protein